MPLTLLPDLHLCLGVHIRFLPGWSVKKLSVHTMHVSLAKQVITQLKPILTFWPPSKYLLDLQYILLVFRFFFRLTLRKKLIAK